MYETALQLDQRIVSNFTKNKTILDGTRSPEVKKEVLILDSRFRHKRKKLTVDRQQSKVLVDGQLDLSPAGVARVAPLPRRRQPAPPEALDRRPGRLSNGRFLSVARGRLAGGQQTFGEKARPTSTTTSSVVRRCSRSLGRSELVVAFR